MDTDMEHVDESPHDPVRVSRIAKIMDQIFENFEDHELTRFINIIREVGDSGDLVRDFTKLIMFRRGISVNLIRQAVRSLLAVQHDPRLWKPVWDQVSRIAGKLNFSSIADSGELDEETLKKYHEVLKFGIENVRHIRLMMVGMFGVGKTTIVRRMCNEDVCNVKSTNGIDVSLNACEVDDKREWRVTGVKEAEKREMHYKSRIRNANKVTQPPRPAAESNPITHIVPETDQSGHPIATDEHVEEYDMQFSVSKPSSKPTMRFIESINKAAKAEKDTESTFFYGLKEAVNDKTEAAPEKRITTVSIWDFGGQSVYYSTHHFFLSSRAIYLLVLNISKKLSDPVPEDDNRATSMPKGFTCLDAFKFWMNSIYTYTAARKDGSNAKRPKYRPKIVLVGTFKDQVVEENKEEYKERYFQQALQSFTDSEVLELVHNKKFFVSKHDPADTFNTLKNELLSIAENQVFWNEEVPIKWMPLERSIEVRTRKPFSTDNTKTDDQSSIMELNELVQIDKDTEYPLDDTNQLKVFLQFQHALGNVLYYDAKELEETIILHPQWILNVFKLFVTHAPIPDMDPMLTSDRKQFKKTAILSGPLIDELVKRSVDKTFSKYKKEIVQYMEHLDVIAKPINYTQNRSAESSSDDEDEDQHTKEQSTQIKTDVYIVPCLLSLKPPEDELKRLVQPNETSTPILCLVFKNNFLPPVVCHRLLATCIRRWELLHKKDQLMLFNGMGNFILDPSRTSWLSMWWKDHIIYMQVSRCTDKENPVDGELCSSVRRRIQQMIRQIFSIHGNFTGKDGENQNVQYIEHIKCPECHNASASKNECDDDVQTRMIPMSMFLTYAYDEANCGHSHTMGRDAALSCWYFEENEEQKVRDRKKAEFKLHDDEKGAYPKQDTHTHNINATVGKDVNEGLGELPNTGDGLDSRKCELHDGRVWQASPKELDELQNMCKERNPIGEGYFGKVYSSDSTRSKWGISIAIKKIPNVMKNSRSIINELLAGRIKHFSIMPLLMKGSNDNFHYFVFPYYENGNLRDAIKKDMENPDKICLCPLERIRILYQLTCGLQYLHTEVPGVRRPIIHGDLTSNNIVLDKKYNACILDFGLTRQLQEGKSSLTSTTTHQYTPGCWPEKENPSLQTDWFQFGVVMLELISGKPPLIGEGVLYEILNSRERLFDAKVEAAIRKKIWSDDWKKNHYEKMKDLAKACLGLYKSPEKTEELSQKVFKTFEGELRSDYSQPYFEVQEASGEKCEEKCVYCKIHPAVTMDNQKILLQMCDLSCSHDKFRICIACMRKSFLNPLRCFCNQELRTTIGSGWGALLIWGTDEEYDETLKKDVDGLADVMSSKFPLVMGIREENIFKLKHNDTLKDELKKALEKISEMGISKLFLYYTGHSIEKDTFIKEFNINGTVECPCLESIFIILDCCFASCLSTTDIEFLKEKCVTRINATSKIEKTYMKSNVGSNFTRYLKQALTAKKCENMCSTCEKYLSMKHGGVIELGMLTEFLGKHLKKLYCRVTEETDPIALEDKVIGYLIDFPPNIKFSIRGNEQLSEEMRTLPKTFEDLQVTLFESCLKKEKIISKDKLPEALVNYRDTVSITFVDGPKEGNTHELSKLTEVQTAWDQHLPLYYAIREVKNLGNGRVLIPLREDEGIEEIKTILGRIQLEQEPRENPENCISLMIGTVWSFSEKGRIQRKVGEKENLTSACDKLGSIFDNLSTVSTITKDEHILFEFPTEEVQRIFKFFTIKWEKVKVSSMDASEVVYINPLEAQNNQDAQTRD